MKKPDGVLDDELNKLDEKTAAFVVQSPNFFGCVEDLQKLGRQSARSRRTVYRRRHGSDFVRFIKIARRVRRGYCRRRRSKFRNPDVVSADRIVGLFACTEKYVRQMPGRLAGVAYDKNGKRGFVLTLATREQHIRRDKATSNICTNQGLIALAATIYMEAMGKKGLQEVAMQNAQKAAYAKKQIAAISGFEIPFSSPTFNEFVVRAPKNANEILEKLRIEKNIIGGLPLSWHYNDFANDFLVCVTETNTKEQIDNLVEGLKSVS